MRTRLAECFVLATLMGFGGEAAAKPRVSYDVVGFATTDFTVTDEYPTCLNVAPQISIRELQIRHPRSPGGLEQGTLAIRIADSTLFMCHVIGAERTVSKKFRVDTEALVTETDLLTLRRASPYALEINGFRIGAIEVGLLGEHRVTLLPEFTDQSAD